MHVSRACVIRRPRAPLYAFWRELENLPRIIRHPASVSPISATRSHWAVAAPPFAGLIEWEARIVADLPDRRLAWRSLPGAPIPNAGTVFFDTVSEQVTRVIVALEYEPPGGWLLSTLARFSALEPGRQLADSLRLFKCLMESSASPRVNGPRFKIPLGLSWH